MINQTESIKHADTTYDLHPVIANRWSPRAFSNQDISEEQLMELFEAARWAASSYNEQPWRYTYAVRGTKGFDQLANTLMAGNKPWASKAAALVVAMAKTTLSSNGKTNGVALHDLGMANAQLLAQATHRNIYAHMMGGFYKDQVKELLALNEDTQPVCVIALGHLGDVDTLEEPLRSREQAPRSRNPLADMVQKI